MDDQGLEEFRRRWQEELALSQAQRRRRRPEAGERRPRRPEAGARGEQASGYLALAQGLLEGAGRPPAPRPGRADRRDASSRSRSPPDRDAAEPEPLVDQLIRDLVSGRGKMTFPVTHPTEVPTRSHQGLCTPRTPPEALDLPWEFCLQTFLGVDSRCVRALGLQEGTAMLRTEFPKRDSYHKVLLKQNNKQIQQNFF